MAEILFTFQLRRSDLADVMRENGIQPTPYNVDVAASHIVDYLTNNLPSLLRDQVDGILKALPFKRGEWTLYKTVPPRAARLVPDLVRNLNATRPDIEVETERLPDGGMKVFVRKK